MAENTRKTLFQTLEPKATPWTRWAGSLAINTAIIVLLLIIPVTVKKTFIPAERVVDVSLVAPMLTPYRPVPRPHIVRPEPNPIVPPPKVETVKKTFQAPVVAKRAEAPKIELQPAPVEAPKPVEVAKFEAPEIHVQHRDVFPASNEAPPSPAPVRAIKVGGFGDPNGVPANTSSTKPAMLAQVGSFDLAQGSGHGSGSGSNGKTLVASAGFGNGYGAGGSASGGPGRGAVKTGGFGGGFETAGGHATAVAAKPAPPAETPVEILYKPKPVYTAEARENKIEGDVQLEVLFSSAGQIQVLKLIRGLGYGLDENARVAATQIRFRPSTRNGTPVDTTGTVHIVFQIS